MRSLETWLGGYLWERVRRMVAAPAGRPLHVLFCVVDHFEPVADAGSTVERERARMRAWMEGYPRLAARHRDSDGVAPQHTWFYPAENYRAEYLEALSRLCGQGLGEIELHLHHGHDDTASLRERLVRALSEFGRHGALVTQGVPPVRTYGFIHGNMALDNSMGDPRWCGVDNELSVLQETGCYADFSMPTAPASSQTRKINGVYYAVGRAGASKSHDRGIDARVGGTAREGLLIIQGPLALNWRRRKFGALPRIDNAEITGRFPGTPDRVRRWRRQHVHVKGRPEWLIIKVSCHGAEEQHQGALLGEAADRLYTTLEAEFRDRPHYRLHYVTARELYNVVKAAEAGAEGDPGGYRDFVIPPYVNRSAVARERSAARA
jgi:hypothetical protein